MRRTLTLALLPLVAGVFALPSSDLPAHSTPVPAAAPTVQPNPDHITTLTAVLQNMKTNYATYARSTPGPQDIFDYNIGDLWLKGIDGTGTTIALIEGWDDPQINTVIDTFDKKYGLPDPDIQTIYPNGQLPATCPPGMVALGSYGSCSAWAGELRLDVETAHLIAPYAKIVISATPADSEITDDTASQVAPPEMMRALEYIGQNHLADAISISDGTGESTYTYGKAQLTAQDPGELTAAADGIPVMVATGDCGVVQNLAVASSQCGNTTTGPDTAAWDDSPWVTAVGGSVPDLDATTGAKLGPDPLWHSGKFSEGAGYSEVYARPDYQNKVASITGSDMRSVPDITMDSQDGTSESSPMFAGVLALAAQLNRGSVGPVNDLLYQVLGPRGAKDGISDVVSGDNSVLNGTTVVVPGFTAGAGFDVASGWGSLDASKFVPALVAASRAQNGPNSEREQAAAALSRLQHGIQLTTTNIRAGSQAYLSAGGFLPQHPVVLNIDGRPVATLTANTLGAVSYNVDPSVLTLPPGSHTVSLTSMLLTQTAKFRSS
ncbi:MAG TPA: S53 family peptidase [Pseudonocardiaceae bacterium]|jgi:subtilase family serine protease|nr:S53 family peptidase [Pseudonocardiaceae bacterium]